jgi:rhomboid domain-containing protein 1
VLPFILAKSLLHLFDYDAPYYNQLAVGFSGVLFALKVMLNACSDADYYVVHGLLIPSKYTAWAKLILIQLFVPDAYFIGHIGGILAGLFYLRLGHTFSGPDPISLLVRGFVKMVSWPFRFLHGSSGQLSGQGQVGLGSDGTGVWRCPLCIFDNSGWMDVHKMCSTPHGTTRNQHQFSIDEIHQISLQRFDRLSSQSNHLISLPYPTFFGNLV